MSNHDMWTFKHEPKSLDKMVLHPEVRKKLKKVIREVPNTILYGKAGTGKGTFTHIFLRETGYDKLWVNASDETGIDTIRDKVRSFATAMSTKDLKIVVLNEADSLTSNQQGAQKILRQLMEDTHKVTRFFFLANYAHFIIPELKSRCTSIEMKPAPGKDLFDFCEKVLKSEKVQYNKKDIVGIIKKCHPDIRRTISALQENTIDGKLVGDTVDTSEDLYRKFLDSMKAMDVDNIRKLFKNEVVNYVGLYEFLFENIGEFKSPADAVLEIGEHLYRNDMVANREINFVHMVINMIKRKIL